jgi:hypothetical protein
MLFYIIDHTWINCKNETFGPEPVRQIANDPGIQSIWTIYYTTFQIVVLLGTHSCTSIIDIHQIGERFSILNEFSGALKELAKFLFIGNWIPSHHIGTFFGWPYIIKSSARTHSRAYFCKKYSKKSAWSTLLTSPPKIENIHSTCSQLECQLPAYGSFADVHKCEQGSATCRTGICLWPSAARQAR